MTTHHDTTAASDRGATAVPLAVVIVHYNRADLLERCMSALSRQSSLPEHVLIVDNGGTPFEVPSDTCLPSIEVLRIDTNVGFAAAMNRGMDRLRRFEWIASLNPDTEPERDWLRELHRAVLRCGEQVGSFASHLLCAADRSVSDGAGDGYHVWGLAWRQGWGGAADTVGGEVREVFSACAAAALYRTQAWREVGGFDERYFCYFEDVDLGYRLRLAGFSCLLVPGARVAHVGSASTSPRSDFAVRHGHRNRIWCYLKNTPPGLLLRTLPGHLALNLAVVAVCIWRGQGRAITRAMVEAIVGIPLALRQRRQVQRLRRVSTRHLAAHMSRGLRRHPRVSTSMAVGQ